MKTNTLLELNPKDISEQKGFNTRYDLGDLRELKSSMTNKGFDRSEPLIVREDPDNKGKYILGAQGHRRLTAAMELELDTVFAVLEDSELSDTDRNLDIVRLNSGEPLPQLAVARVVERALADDKDLTQAAVAKLLGKSPTFIGDCIKLTKCTKATQKFIEKEKVSAAQVVEIVNELEAKDEVGFQKVEEKLEKLISKVGDKKVTAKTKAKAEKEDGESDSEREEREAAEAEEKDAREKQKARTKELIATEKRVNKFVADVMEMVAKANALADDDALTPHQSALLDLQVATAAYLAGKTTDTSRNLVEGEASKMSDIGAAQRALEKCHKETVKETVTEVKEAAKETVEAVKAQVKATKEEAKKRIAAVKEAAKA
jgi:ParB/RepB/Spo0J family partition protein